MTVRLIVGLGNPGMPMTRHNAGRMVVQALGDRESALFKYEKSFSAQVASLVTHERRRVYLCLPETYMNQSGRAVTAMCHYYDISAEETVVAVDCMAFDLGRLKLQPSGGAGGHNGLADIEKYIGQNYIRLRIGIGQARGSYEDHVLGRFTQDEQKMLPLQEAMDALHRLTRENFARVATEFNTRIQNERTNTTA